MHRLLLPLFAVAVAAGVVVLAIAALVPLDDDTAAAAIPAKDEVAAVAAATGPVAVHRTESCGCCGGHVDHLRDAGFEVEDHVHADEAAVATVRHDLGVPEPLWSCHTTVVEGRAVEGHVPADVIVTLLDHEHDVDGGALPGMPAGSPGRAGPKTGTWTFPTFVDGVEADVLTQR